MKIETNIPYQEKPSLTKTMRKLRVGDSFLVENKDRHKVYQIAFSVKIKVKSQILENRQVRVWRTE